MMSVVIEYCEGCFYRKTFASLGPYCDYLCMTGRKRPCPAGDGCTVRVLVRREHPTAFTIFPKRKRISANMTEEEIAAIREYRRERQREYDHRRYLKNREKRKEISRIYSKEYYEKNKEKVHAKQAEWRANNREHLAEYAREYRKKQKEKNTDG